MAAVDGILFVVSAPSGAGKTTLVRALLERDAALALSVSYTTRAMRAGESDGVHYNFITLDVFAAMRDRGDFIEWAQVHDNFYGTSRSWLQSRLAQGKDVVVEIDWQGAAQVREVFGERVVSIFILPPSLETLRTRLDLRATDDEQTIVRRTAAARGEMRHAGDFDYVILNADLDRAVDELCAVVLAARVRVARQRALHAAYFASFEMD